MQCPVLQKERDVLRYTLEKKSYGAEVLRPEIGVTKVFLEGPALKE